MNTYFIHDVEGRLLGWIDAANESDANSIKEAVYDQAVTLNSRPDPDWRIRREAISQKPAVGFAA